MKTIHAPLLLCALLVSACGDGSDPVSGNDGASCDAGATWNGTECAVYAVRSTLRVPTPWREGGNDVTLQMIAYVPLGAGPYPTIVFHHGSTGNGDNPALFGLTYESESLAFFFAERGWMVLFPQRRGRGGSGGLYDEGFTPDRSRYSCQAAPALAGLERALQDADVLTSFVLGMSDVDPQRLVVGGISRGGILATAHAQRRPTVYRGVLNFVGGWLGEACSDAETVNRSTFERAAAQPTPVLWLYGENDPFYSAAHSRGNYDAFVASGGSGTFRLYRRSDVSASGHFIINEPSLWRSDLESFLRTVAP
jgi:dienelactone hydrolase